MAKKLTLPQCKEVKKQGKRLRMITAYDYPFARLVDESDIEIILVGDSLGMVVLGYDSTVPVTLEEMIHHCRPVVRGAKNTLIVADMPFGTYNVSPEDAIRNGNRMLKESGIEAVKIEGGTHIAPTVRALVDAGIPVMGHIGLTPQTAAQLGGFKVQGKTEEAAEQMLKDALALEAAGAFSVVIECVPAGLARTITDSLSIPTIGIGAGPFCDGQVLVIQDLLGMYDRFIPKFVKQYAQTGPVIRSALNEYAREVADGVFPDREHSFGMDDEMKGLY
ncbi:3-methyl-2-oxobutanoate hydroxymethyltransferase [Heliobacterium gestii]|uniref:3-methyl-2-oxobutanoate hydroxymethyltransferase n=1 Tax=Heliomicrobium gestii TaxID=2699 RepID=A0A845LBE9_HELGE|nr:3-methyl-2-oxobutanoate hydroxymethyltransferase [Heliomicrobium gestii]MBM7866821.1 3-methyl-2-oxobutanoate hydroxymethyltransferase [Heliomicrobium gestii]MZP42250.1 3-methyl-2-oxobutanoate hydroxymethyltransferase [Heliomicrobium gestii]